ncbi:hypothetical protein Q9189_005547 [Teloschistes chrysophthalmus]
MRLCSRGDWKSQAVRTDHEKNLTWKEWAETANGSEAGEGTTYHWEEWLSQGEQYLLCPVNLHHVVQPNSVCSYSKERGRPDTEPFTFPISSVLNPWSRQPATTPEWRKLWRRLNLTNRACNTEEQSIFPEATQKSTEAEACG